jgi:hypothetical protein
MSFIGGGSLRTALKEYAAHYNRERNHRGIGNRRIERRPKHSSRVGEVIRRPRLGGLLNYYERAA